MDELMMLRGGRALEELTRLLEARSLVVMVVRRFEELEQCCLQDPPQVVLLDYASPELDPIEMCRRWKLTRPLYFPSLVFVADELELRDVIDGLRTGANLVLTPPFRAEEVVSTILEEIHRFEGLSLPLESAFVVSDKVDYLAATNRFLDLVFHATDAAPDVVEDLRLCMGELGMNAIVHGNRGDTGKKVHVHYRIEPKRVSVSIADEGPGFRPDLLPDPTSPERLLLPTGRGIFLVRRFTDELSFNERGNEVRFVKRIA